MPVFVCMRFCSFIICVSVFLSMHIINCAQYPYKCVFVSLRIVCVSASVCVRVPTRCVCMNMLRSNASNSHLNGGRNMFGLYFSNCGVCLVFSCFLQCKYLHIMSMESAAL